MSPLLKAPRVQTGGLLLAPSSLTKAGRASKALGLLLMLWTAPPPAHECQGCGCC